MSHSSSRPGANNGYPWPRDPRDNYAAASRPRPARDPNGPSVEELVAQRAAASSRPGVPDSYTLHQRSPGVIGLFYFGWDRDEQTIEDVELFARSRRTGILVVGLICALLIFSVLAFRDPPTAFTLIVVAVLVLIAGLLNRASYVSACGWLLVVVTLSAVIGGIHASELGLSAGKLDTVYMSTYDLLALPVVIAATTLRSRWILVVGAVAMAAFLGDFFYLEQPTGDLVRWLTFEGPVPLLARTIGLLIMVSLTAYLYVANNERTLRSQLITDNLLQAERHKVEEARSLQWAERELRENMLLQLVRAARGELPIDQITFGVTDPHNPFQPYALMLTQFVRRIAHGWRAAEVRAVAAEERAGKAEARANELSRRVAPPHLTPAAGSPASPATSSSYSGPFPPSMPQPSMPGFPSGSIPGGSGQMSASSLLDDDNMPAWLRGARSGPSSSSS